MAAGGGVVPLAEVKRFMADCLVQVGSSRGHAEQMAELLAAADYRGHFSHGMNRLEMYVDDIKTKACDPNAEPQVLKETVATAWVDGRNGLGAVVGNFCMRLAIQKARQAGVGWVVAKGSNHFGIASWYSDQAAKEGMLGMSFTNTSPAMAPTRAKQAALGTNPLAFSAPGKGSDALMLDMATTSVAMGKIEMQKRKGNPIPEGWALDAKGCSTTNADVALKALCLSPLGGPEEKSGYKGYGLSLMVETLCGILGGAAYGPNIRRWMEGTDPANLGHCFVVIDPGCFAPGFSDRLSDLMGKLRHMQPVDVSKPVLVPGDPEQAHMKQVDQKGGVCYVQNQIKASLELAKILGVTPLRLT